MSACDSPFAQDAHRLVLAAVADVGRSGELRAHLLPEVKARRVAEAAGRATLDAVGLVLTDLPPVAREARHATVGDAPEGALVAGDAAGKYFPRDGRVVFADLRGNLLEGCALPECVFDLQTLDVCDVLVLGHDGSFCLRPRDCGTQTMEPDAVQDWQTNCARPARRGARLLCQSTHFTLHSSRFLVA